MTVQYGITMHMYIFRRKNLAFVKADPQTAKFLGFNLWYGYK